MRHLGSLLAAIVIAPAAWLLLAIGQQETSTKITTWLAEGKFDTAPLVGPAAYLVAAGILLGLVATLRISPVGPLVGGLFYVVVFAALFVSPLRVIRAVPETVDLRWVDASPRVPLINGTLAALGVCLLVAAFSAQRWRRWPEALPTVEAAATPALPPLTSDSPWPAITVPPSPTDGADEADRGAADDEAAKPRVSTLKSSGATTADGPSDGEPATESTSLGATAETPSRASGASSPWSGPPGSATL